MWCSIRRVMQYAGLFVIAAFLFNGITLQPSVNSGDAVIDAPRSVSSYQSLLDTKEFSPEVKPPLLKTQITSPSRTLPTT